MASVSTSSPGSLKPWLLVGLGNPGLPYYGTRHNVGFELLDFIAEAEGIDMSSISFKSYFGTGSIGIVPVILAKPQTFMDASGESVAAIVSHYKIPLEQVLVIFDHMDLPFPKLRLSHRGGHGGHTGMRSVIDHLKSGEYIPHLRIGIGRPLGNISSAKFVLGHFKSEERSELDSTFLLGWEAVRILLCEGYDKSATFVNSIKYVEGHLARTLNEAKLMRALKRKNAGGQQDSVDEEEGLKRKKVGEQRDLIDEEEGPSALRVKHERKSPPAGRALLSSPSASLEKVSEGASLEKGSEGAIAPDAHTVISSVPGSSTSSSLGEGVRCFPDKYVPDWSVTNNDSLLEDPETAAALLRGLILERDRQFIHGQSVEVVASNFFHDLGKVIVRANMLRDFLHTQSQSILNSDERIKIFHDRATQLEKMYKECRAREDELSSKNSELQSLLEAKDKAVAEAASKAVEEFKSSAEFKRLGQGHKNIFEGSQDHRAELASLSAHYYESGFEDCKKQLGKKMNGSWNFLRVEELDGLSSPRH